MNVFSFLFCPSKEKLKKKTFKKISLFSPALSKQPGTMSPIGHSL